MRCYSRAARLRRHIHISDAFFDLHPILAERHVAAISEPNAHWTLNTVAELTAVVRRDRLVLRFISEAEMEQQD